MSAKIFIGGDSSQAQAALGAVGDSMSGFRQQAKVMAEEMRDAFAGSKQPVKNFKLELAAVTTIAGQVAGAVRAIGEAVSGPIKAAAAIQDSEIAFTQFLGSAEAARDLIQEIDQFSVSTPFEPAQIRDASELLLGAGLAGGEVLGIVKELAAVSKDGYQLSELGDALAKGFTKGKFQTEELNKFLERGINLMPEFEEVTGKTGEALTKAIQKGLAFDQVREAIAAMSAEGGQFFGMLEARSQSATGQFSTLTGAIEQAAADMAKPILGEFQDSMADALAMLPAFADELKTVGLIVADTVAVGIGIATNVKAAASEAKPLVTVIGAVGGAMAIMKVSGAIAGMQITKSMQQVGVSIMSVRVQYQQAAAGATTFGARAAAAGHVAAGGIRAAAGAAVGMSVALAGMAGVFVLISQAASNAAANIRLTGDVAKSFAEVQRQIRENSKAIKGVGNEEEREALRDQMKGKLDELESKRKELQEAKRALGEVDPEGYFKNAFQAGAKMFGGGETDAEKFGQQSALSNQLADTTRMILDQKRALDGLNDATAPAILAEQQEKLAKSITEANHALAEQQRKLDRLRAEAGGDTDKVQQLDDQDRFGEIAGGLIGDGVNFKHAGKAALEQMALEKLAEARKEAAKAGDERSVDDNAVALLRAEIEGNEKKLKLLKEQQRIAELTAAHIKNGLGSAEAERRAKERAALEATASSKNGGHAGQKATGNIVADSLARVGGGGRGFATNSPLLGVTQRQLQRQDSILRVVERIANKPDSPAGNTATYA